MTGPVIAVSHDADRASDSSDARDGVVDEAPGAVDLGPVEGPAGNGSGEN